LPTQLLRGAQAVNPGIQKAKRARERQYLGFLVSRFSGQATAWSEVSLFPRRHNLLLPRPGTNREEPPFGLGGCRRCSRLEL